MSFFTKWVRNVLPGRYQQDSAETDHDSDSSWPLGQRRHQDEAEKQHQIKVTRPDPEKAIDSLIAARAHNIQKGRLTGLPEEILLCILEQVSDDVVTLYCLRRVSWIFRRIIYEPRIWRHVRTDGTSFESHWNLSEDERPRMKLHLQRDGMCEECMFWCEVLGNGLFRKVIGYQELNSNRPSEDSSCKFYSASAPLRRLHCSPCGTHHDPHAFSSPYQDPGRQDMGCLGRQGAVQFCEHMHLYWSDIENHITQWEKNRPRPWLGKIWKRCLAQFELECHDPSHDTRCTVEDPPSWPRARLQVHDLCKPTVVLTLEWKLHSGLDVATRNTDGLTPATQLRELFRRQRNGPAAILFPSTPSKPLPEMACYDTSTCRCVYYEGGSGKAVTSGLSLNQGRSCGYHHSFGRLLFYTRSERVHTEEHWPRGEGGPACLITAYQRYTPLFSTRPDGKVNPSYDWFHAMDPETYPWQPGSHVLPLCRNTGCMNYYKRPKVFRCVGWPSTIHYPCICEG